MTEVSRRELLLAAIVAAAAVAVGGYFIFVGSGESNGVAQARIHNARGIELLESGRPTEAADQFRQATGLDPDYYHGQLNLGIAFFHSGSDERAREALLAAVKLVPDGVQSSYLLGRLDLLEDQEADAIERFNEALLSDPNDPFTNYFLGKLYFDAGRMSEARERLEKAILVDGAMAAAHYTLGLILLQEGDETGGLNEMLAYNQFVIRRQADDLGTRPYLDEGRYARAVEDPDGPDDAIVSPEATAVRFTDVTQGLGIRFAHGGSTDPDIWRSQPVTLYRELLREQVTSFFGSGAAFLDYDGDGNLDLYIANAGPTDTESANVLFRNAGDGTFEDVTDQGGVGHTGQGMGVTFGDFDNDDDPDLYVTNAGPNVLFRNEGDGTFTDVTAQARVGDTGFGLGTTFVDIDHDGHLDLFVANYVDLDAIADGEAIQFPHDVPGQHNVLYLNNQDGTFSDVTVDANLDGAAPSVGAVFFDYDGDNDVDFYLGNDGQPGILYSNNRDGSFSDVTGESGLAGVVASRGVAAGDYNGDSFIDLLVNSGLTNGTSLIVNQGDGTFATDQSFRALADRRDDVPAWGASFIDYNNDGALDVSLLYGESNGAIVLFPNRGDGTFSDVETETGLHEVAIDRGRGMALGDYDNDGDTDIFVVNNGARPVLIQNDGGNQNAWLKLTTVGDGSNRMGLGSKIEIKAGQLWQKREVRGGSGYLSQNSSELLFGLGDEQQIGMVHVLWPSGLRQRPSEFSVNRDLTVIEQGRKSSCPLLYTWDGERYTFITDFLGAGFIGILVGPDTYYQPDSDEYVRIDGSLLLEKGGQYSIKITEQLEEVSYLDEVRLLVVDHPSGTEIYPNEVLKMGPPFPEFKVHVTADARPPIFATDGDGRDILAAVSDLDRNYPTFPLLPYQGISATHSIVLDLGDLSGSDRVLLLMDGWIEYWNSQSVRQALDDGVPLQAPKLEVWSDETGWVTVIEDFGFPSGLPKTMTVDLTGVFLSDDYRVRITTNMEIYWDRIRVSAGAGDAPVKITTLAPSRAALDWRGYPKLSLPDGKNPPVFLHDQPVDTAPFADHAGYYTRYGEVTSLLHELDDQFVIVHHGEEIDLTFPADSVAALPEGWTRDFLLYVDGYVKDGWRDTAHGNTVAPLPFHGMSSYPYPDGEAYPDDQEHREYLRDYNTRWIGSAPDRP